MVSTRSTLRRVPEDGSPDPTTGGATSAAQSNVTRAGTRTRRGRAESKTSSRNLQPPRENASPAAAGPSRTARPVTRKKKGPYSALPPTSHRKNHSISTAFNALGIEEALGTPEVSRSSSLSPSSGKSKRSHGKGPAASSDRDETSLLPLPIPEQELQSSSVAHKNEVAEAIITPRRKGRPYKVDLNDVAPRTPPQHVHPTKVLTHTPPIEFTSKNGPSFHKVIRSDHDLMTPEAIAKRSMEREVNLQAIARRAHQAIFTASMFEDSDDEDSDTGDELPQIELPMDLGDLIREEAIPPPPQKGPLTLGPEGTHIILDHFALSYGGTWQRTPPEYPKEWVDAHNQGLTRRDTDIIDDP